MEHIQNLLTAISKEEGNSLQQLLSNPVNRLANHSEVELTEAEIAEALIKAKVDKHAKMEYDRAHQLRVQRSKEIMEPFTASQLISYSHRLYEHTRKNTFTIDEHNEALVSKLAQYFTGDPEFNVGDHSLDKGLCIMGNVGVGKTELLRFFQKNKRNCFNIFTCAHVADSFLMYGEETDKMWSTPMEMPMNDPTVFFQKRVGMCFDDLGTEEIKNHFGNKKNVMADILMAIYNKKNFSVFHLTTNLNSKEIEERYGTRIRSRLREMFNVFEFKGDDRRK